MKTAYRYLHRTLVLSSFCIFIISLHTQAAQVIATVGKKRITMTDFNNRYDDVLKQTINPPTKKEFLEDLIRYEVGLQEARKKGLEKDPLVIERMNQELYKGLIENALSAKVQKIKVNEQEMKKYYSRNPEIRTSHILIEFKPTATQKQIEAARKRAQEIYQEVKKSKRPFKDLVSLYSDDSISKQNGGNTGWQNRLTLVPNYYNAAIKLKSGQIKGLIKTQFGFHIIKFTGKKTYEKANKQSIRAAVFDQKRKEIFDVYFKKLKSNYTIEINKKLIK